MAKVRTMVSINEDVLKLVKARISGDVKAIDAQGLVAAIFPSDLEP